MKTTILSFLAILLLGASVQAQSGKSSGIAVNIGPAVSYYYGQSNHNFKSFDNNRLNYQLNGMLGLTVLRDKNDHRTMIAGFGTFGLNNRNTVEQIFSDQGYISTSLDQSKYNNFYKLEGGLLIGEVLRISTGVGQQVFDEQTLASNGGIDFQTTSLQYYSTTVGFNLNVAAVAITLDCNFNYGKDYNNTVIIPTAGLMFRF